MLQSTKPPVIEALQLSKSYKDQIAVRAIDFIVPQGGCFGMLGPNGAGKTTTLRMILGQCHLTAGQLNVLGMPMPASTRQIRARIGVVPQLDNLDPDFTVIENLVVYASYFGLQKSQIMNRVADLLSLVELADRANTPIGNLSGGMKRRLSVARALINDPEVLVLDEPTTGLDPQVRHMIWARLRELKSSGKTLILTTHYMEEAERLCDELLIMDNGRIISQGKPRDLIRNNVENEVIEIHGNLDRAMNILSTFDNTRFETVGETLYCYTDDPGSLAGHLDGEMELTYLHRPANLEDVFLQLTGRELRD